MAWSSPRTWVTGETVTAAHMNQEVRDNLDAGFPEAVSAVSYTPSLEATISNPNTIGGDGSVTGRRWRVGPFVVVWVRYVWGSTSSNGQGTYFATLPTSASGIAPSTSAWGGQVIGHWSGRDDSGAGNSRGGPVLLRASDAVHFQVDSTGDTVNDTTPFSWTVGDVFSFFAQYPAA